MDGLLKVVPVKCKRDLNGQNIALGFQATSSQGFGLPRPGSGEENELNTL